MWFSAVSAPMNAPRLPLALLSAGTLALPVGAHETSGRHDADTLWEAEAKLFIGRHGYLHGGLGLERALDDSRTLGLRSHFVREGVGEDFFPSLGVVYTQDLPGESELAASVFGYFEVEDEHALGATLKFTKNFDLGACGTVSPFFSPAFAHAQAIDEATGSAVDVNHLLLLAGVSWNRGPWELRLFGTHSLFSRDPEGLESHVDLEELTHLAAYENNDGFAEHSVGAGISRAITANLTLAARYAVLFYPEETRHSISLTPEIHFGEASTFFFGAQLLRGNGLENDLYVAGLSVGF